MNTRLLLALTSTSFLLAIGSSFAAEGDWTAPVLKSEDSTEVIQYEPLPARSATKKWHLCVAFPHMKDAYYVGKAYGIYEEARRQGVSATILDAGGYTNLSKQITQVEDCVARGGNAVLLQAISKTGVTKLVEELHAKGIPVLDMGNGIESTRVKARTAALHVMGGMEVGKFLAGRHPKGSGKTTMLWLAGPPGGQWNENTLIGVKKAIADSDVEIVQALYGDTGKEIQMKLVEDGLEAHPKVNYIGGVAPAVEGAAQILRQRGRSDVNLISFYTTPGTEDLVRAGKALATCTDYTVSASRINVDQAVRILEGKPYMEVATRVFLMVNPSNVDSYDRTTMLAPASFKPVFEIK